MRIFARDAWDLVDASDFPEVLSSSSLDAKGSGRSRGLGSDVGLMSVMVELGKSLRWVVVGRVLIDS